MKQSYVIPFIFKLRYITSHPEASITLRTDYVVHGNKLPLSKIQNSLLDRTTRGGFFYAFTRRHRALLAHSIKLAVNAYRTEAGLDPLLGGYGCLLGTHRG